MDESFLASLRVFKRLLMLKQALVGILIVILKENNGVVQQSHDKGALNTFPLTHMISDLFAVLNNAFISTTEPEGCHCFDVELTNLAVMAPLE